MTEELDQLIAEITERANAVNGALGLPPPNIESRAMMAGALLKHGSEAEARHVAQAVVDALWPSGTTPPNEWWGTPLGRLVARWLVVDDTTPLTYAAAAEMLGVTRGTVGTLVSRGTLAKHSAGGVKRSAVMERLARQ